MTDSYNLGPDNFEVFSDTPIVWMGAAIHDETGGVFYIPCAIKDGQMGYCVRSEDASQAEFIYFNPSDDSQGQPNVFIYQGESNDPVNDTPLHHYRVADGWLPRFGEVDLKPFAKDADGNWPPNTAYLFELDHGQAFEDAEGHYFNLVGHGPVQGSLEIVDGLELHAYWDVTTRVEPNMSTKGDISV